MFRTADVNDSKAIEELVAEQGSVAKKRRLELAAPHVDGNAALQHDKRTSAEAYLGQQSRHEALRQRVLAMELAARQPPLP